MNKPVDLSEIAEAIGFAADELHQFVNRKTGEIVVVYEDTMRKADWEGLHNEVNEWQKKENPIFRNISLKFGKKPSD